ncbi:MAG: putative quinol monooxygenase [Acidimicrobiia bacterium]
MGKVSAVAKLEVKPDMADAFPAEWDDMFKHIAANEDGTEHYVLHRSNRDPNVFYMTEIYADQAALDAHGSSDAMAAIGGSLGDYITSADLDFCVPVKAAKGCDL